VKTLIVEGDNETAKRYDSLLSRFPSAKNVRAKSAEEAIALLQKDTLIQQVLIEGKAYTALDALWMLRLLHVPDEIMKRKKSRRLYICPHCDYHGSAFTNSKKFPCARCGQQIDYGRDARFSRRRLAEARAKKR
jgi:predicted RNA-binding Zn-ribbon protein involved in translation (DUF1610 family)